MFLQYATPGAVVPLYSLRLTELGFTRMEIGLGAATQALAALIAPLLAGQIADRRLPAERCLCGCALAASGMLWLLASLTTPTAMIALTFLTWLVVVPVLTLGTSLTFTHLNNPERHFGSVRLWGTVGWMASSWLLGYWFSNPTWAAPLLAWLRPEAPHALLADAFRLASLLALAISLYALTLPRTRPQRQANAPLAPLAALKLLRGRPFAVFAVCAFGVCFTLPFSTQTTPLLLESLGIPRTWLTPTLTFAQTSEVLGLATLPIVLLRLGRRGTMLLGLSAWAVATFVLAVGHPVAVVVGSLSLHGMCICFFLVVGQVFMNSRARGDVRASVQGLFSFITGTGMLAGNLVVGWVRELVAGDFPTTFRVAAAITAALVVIFLIGFTEKGTMDQKERPAVPEDGRPESAPTNDHSTLRPAR